MHGIQLVASLADVSLAVKWRQRIRLAMSNTKEGSLECKGVDG